MFFQSLLPSFNLNNVGGNAADQQQQNVIANVEQAAARIVQGGAGNRGQQEAVNDEVAEVDRHLQALNMNLENAAVEGWLFDIN